MYKILIEKLKALRQYFVRRSKTIYKPYPIVGDKVKVRVGFGGYLKGIVSKVVINDHDAYCWIDEYSSSGKWLRSGTASFSYCVFEYL
jgi:hypothetical protein